VVAFALLTLSLSSCGDQLWVPEILSGSVPEILAGPA
jgi:hypothetical protein